jgi:hypothetical protein
MPRRPTYLKKFGKIQVDKLERKCRYCMTHRSTRGFDKHEAWCKKTWMIRKELRDVNRAHAIANQLQAEAMRSSSPTLPSSSCLIGFSANTGTEFVEGSSSVHMEVDYPSPEMDSKEPTTAVNLDGTLTPSQTMLLRILQTLQSYLDPIYRRNTLKLFPIPILQTRLQK